MEEPLQCAEMAKVIGIDLGTTLQQSAKWAPTPSEERFTVRIFLTPPHVFQHRGETCSTD
jgi:hypothetical protein